MATKFETVLAKIEALDYELQRKLFFELAGKAYISKNSHRDCADLVRLCSRVGCDANEVEALRIICLMHLRSDCELCMDKSAFKTPRSGLVLKLRTTEFSLDVCEVKESFLARTALSLFIQAFCWSEIKKLNSGPVTLLSAVSAQENWDRALEIAESECKRIGSGEANRG